MQVRVLEIPVRTIEYAYVHCFSKHLRQSNFNNISRRCAQVYVGRCILVRYTKEVQFNLEFGLSGSDTLYSEITEVYIYIYDTLYTDILKLLKYDYTGDGDEYWPHTSRLITLSRKTLVRTLESLLNAQHLSKSDVS